MKTKLVLFSALLLSTSAKTHGGEVHMDVSEAPSSTIPGKSVLERREELFESRKKNDRLDFGDHLHEENHEEDFLGRSRTRWYEDDDDEPDTGKRP